MELLDSAMMKKKTRRSDLFVFFFVWVSSFFVFFAFLSFCDEAIETSDGKKNGSTRPSWWVCWCRTSLVAGAVLPIFQDGLRVSFEFFFALPFGSPSLTLVPSFFFGIFFRIGCLATECRLCRERERDEEEEEEEEEEGRGGGEEREKKRKLTKRRPHLAGKSEGDSIRLVYRVFFFYSPHIAFYLRGRLREMNNISQKLFRLFRVRVSKQDATEIVFDRDVLRVNYRVFFFACGTGLCADRPKTAKRKWKTRRSENHVTKSETKEKEKGSNSQHSRRTHLNGKWPIRLADAAIDF